MIQTESEQAETVDWWYATVMGLVEGLTEFLPVSSTGHLIVTSAAFERAESSAFQMGIQMGAITAILFLYWRPVYDAIRSMFGGKATNSRSGDGTIPQSVNLLWLIFVAAMPAAIVGLIFEDDIDELLFNNKTVGITLIVGGLLFFVLEAWQKRRGIVEETAEVMERMTLKHAFVIGLFQTLALVPGVSRSGATIAGGMVAGFRRTASAEFSFLVGLPILYGAALVKLRKNTEILSDNVLLVEFLVASFASFVSAALVVKPFVHFLQRHTFVPFGWYRIVAGTTLLVLVQQGVLVDK